MADLTEAEVRALARARQLPLTAEDTAEVTHRLNAFLEAIRDATHPRYHELRDEVAGEFDPEAFDLNQVNRALKRYM